MRALLRSFSASSLIFGVVHCRANAQQPKLFVGMILILIFAEALALYGLIGAPLQREVAACMACTRVTFVLTE